MDVLDTIFDPLRDFAKDSIRLIKRCHKPDCKEFTKVAVHMAIGFVVMGFVGFFTKLIFIPINNIIGIEEKRKPSLTHQSTLRRSGACPSRAADERRFTIFFLLKPLTIADLHNIRMKIAKSPFMEASEPTRHALSGMLGTWAASSELVSADLHSGGNDSHQVSTNRGSWASFSNGWGTVVHHLRFRGMVTTETVVDRDIGGTQCSTVMVSKSRGK
ncbi:hypothetical protein Cgig2_003082 [Carnegiea gigantea]|uniref:Protein transport protein Sec61 subunit gamma n=1 Tax=Carnegiea gigantea TaxID=171969 RepID=A0A9Q1KEV3_9CARY|nr:hypothetical protein Cgig2_003082 [Carnegiea gigantea]